QDAFGLRGDAALDQLPGPRVEGDLPGAEHESAVRDRLAVRTDRLGRGSGGHDAWHGADVSARGGRPPAGIRADRSARSRRQLGAQRLLDRRRQVGADVAAVAYDVL